MSKKRIGILIVIVFILLVIATIMLRDLQEQRILNLVDIYGGWISLKEPIKSNTFDYYNDPKNWRETEQLIGQASLKFLSQNEFTCEWKPVHSMRSLIWIVTSCAEKLEGYEEYRSLYLLFRIGSTGVIESFYVPIGNDYIELVLPFVEDIDDNGLSETWIAHLKLRLSSSREIPPLAYERSDLLK